MNVESRIRKFIAVRLISIQISIPDDQLPCMEKLPSCLWQYVPKSEIFGMQLESKQTITDDRVINHLAKSLSELVKIIETINIRIDCVANEAAPSAPEIRGTKNGIDEDDRRHDCST